MENQEFELLFERQVDICRKMLVTKAKEYATDDRLHNFKQAAALQQTSTLKALAGMMAKHTISVYDMIENAGDHPLPLWEEKITDSINYLILLKALILDESKSEKPVVNIMPARNIHGGDIPLSAPEKKGF